MKKVNILELFHAVEFDLRLDEMMENEKEVVTRILEAGARPVDMLIITVDNQNRLHVVSTGVPLDKKASIFRKLAESMNGGTDNGK